MAELSLELIEETAAGTTPGRFSILHRRGPWRDALRRRMLAGADLLAFVGAALAAAAVSGGGSAAVAAVSALFWLVLSKLYGLYDRDHRALRHLTVDELSTIATWVTTGAATTILLQEVTGTLANASSAAIAFWVTALTLATVLRTFARWLWRTIVPPERALIIGSGALEEATRRKLALFEDIHVQTTSVIDEGDLQHLDGVDAMLALEKMLCTDPPVDRVIVASHRVTETLIAPCVAACKRLGVKLSVVPPARGMFGTAVRLHHIADLPMIEYSTWDMARSTMLIKRVIDVVVASIALVVLSPLMVAVAIAVRLSSPGPVLFVQVRAGLDGRPFRMIKFRTMSADAESRLTDVIDLELLEQPMFKLRADPRVTPLGRFLRRTSLDELPQLINVLRGEMALVGPRPEQLDLVERYELEHRFRLAVKPGLTGPMQVYGRGELRFDERLAVEREYIENLSIGRDLRIMLLTIAPLMRGGGAY